MKGQGAVGSTSHRAWRKATHRAGKTKRSKDNLGIDKTDFQLSAALLAETDYRVCLHLGFVMALDSTLHPGGQDG